METPPIVHILGLESCLQKRGIHLSAKWLKGEAIAGRLPCLRVGRRLLFNPIAVEAALALRAANVTVDGGEVAHVVR
jgi:hypothetical protein